MGKKTQTAMEYQRRFLKAHRRSKTIFEKYLGAIVRGIRVDNRLEGRVIAINGDNWLVDFGCGVELSCHRDLLEIIEIAPQQLELPIRE